MLIIRTEQIAALADAQQRDFRRRLRLRLGIAPCADDAECALARCIDDAAAFGLHAARDVARFAELTWRHAGCYPAGPLPRPALAILMTHGLDPARKLARYACWVDALPAREDAHG